MEPMKPSDDVIVENQEVVEDVQDQPSDDVIVEGQEDVQQVEQTTDDKANKDDYWKNRSYELDRKLNNLTSELPKIIEENIARVIPQKKEEQKYTIAELEAYALEHPEHRPWVEEQKELKRKEEWQQMLKADKEEQRKAQLQAVSEQRTISNPKYSEAFINQNGQTILNPQSKLAHLINDYINHPRLKGQPDSLEIAAKLAYADYMDSSVKDKEVKLNTIKRQNAVLKQKTMPEGGGVNAETAPVDPFVSANQRLSKTGNRKDAEAAVKAYFAKRTGK